MKNWESQLLAGGMLAASVLLVYLAGSLLLAVFSLRCLTRGISEASTKSRRITLRKMKPWQFSLSLSLVFLLGLAGGFAMKAFWPGEARLSPDQSARQARLLARLRRELHLNGQQVERIAPIVSMTSERLDSLHKEHAAQIVQAFEGFDSLIETNLTLEQERQLQSIDAQRKELSAGGERASLLETF